jgi:cyclase
VTVPPRLIPVLSIRDGYLVKTTKFGRSEYIGDPINAVKIFNDKHVDELIICDIDASRTRAEPDYELLESIASEAFMPVGYGGGLTSVDAAVRVLGLGLEKVILGTVLKSDPSFVSELASAVGSQSIVASVDVRRSLLGKYSVHVLSGKEPTGMDPAVWSARAVAAGVGEIIVSSIDRDGTQSGYDLDLVSRVAGAVDVPVVALGGARGLADFREALGAGASAVAAGSLFVHHGKRRAVLITYPDAEEIARLAVHGQPSPDSSAEVGT